jgi:hypothetical protein
MSDGTAVFAEKSKSFYSAQIYEEAREKNAEILDRLCDLEDKIEQGKILELPCAVGEKVWFATCVCDEIGKEKYDALEGEVISFSMQKDGLGVYCRYKWGLTYWHTIDGFKAEVFLTPEEAEAKVRKMEGARE